MAIAPMSGQKVVATAGSPVTLGSGEIKGVFSVKALAANTGIIEIGDVSSVVSGYQLSAKEEIVFVFVDDLGDIYIDSSVNGEGVCWIRWRI